MTKSNIFILLIVSKQQYTKAKDRN